MRLREQRTVVSTGAKTGAGSSAAAPPPILPVESLEEVVHNIAQLDQAAQWLSAHGMHADTAAAKEASGRLCETLAERMSESGLSMLETPTHRATLAHYTHRGSHGASVLVVERGPGTAHSSAGQPQHSTSRSAIEHGDGRQALPSGSSTGGPGGNPPARRQAGNGAAIPAGPPLPPGGLPGAPSEAEQPAHGRLCPLGGAGTRWYVCALHEQRVVFQAGSGLYDSIANSCPRCGRLSALYTGCACEEAERPVSRRRRRRRRPPLPGASEPVAADISGGQQA